MPIKLLSRKRKKVSLLTYEDEAPKPKPKKKAAKPKAKKAKPVQNERVIETVTGQQLEDLKSYGVLGHTSRTRPHMFVLYADYDRRKDIKDNIPFARFSRRLGGWLLPISRESLRHVIHQFPDFKGSQKALTLARETWRNGQREIKLIKRLQAIIDGKVDVSHIEGLGGLQPREYQKIAIACIEEAWAEGYGFGNNDEQGLGKTCTILVTLDRYVASNPDAVIVIFVPKSLRHSVWVSEIVKFTVNLRPQVPEGTIAQRAKQVLQAEQYDWTRVRMIDGIPRTQFIKKVGKPNVIILNHEVGSSRDRQNPDKHNPLVQAIIEMKPDIVVNDEAHKTANITGSKRGKALLDVRLASKYGHDMTGTPGMPQDLYGQLTWRDKRIFPVNYGAFKKRYLRELDIGGHYKKIVGYNYLEELERRSNQFAIRRTQADCPDIPESVSTTVEIDMSKEQQELYDRLCEETEAFYKGHDITKVSLSGKLHALRNITGGHVKGADGKLVRLKNNAKLKAVLEMLNSEIIYRPSNDPSHKAVIACAYREDVALLNDALTEKGIKHVIIHGGIVDTKKNKARTNAASDFVEDPDVKVLVGITSTFGVGLNLVPRLPSICDLMMFWSNNYDPKERDQAEKRIKRGGQTRMCRFVDFLCSGTIDEVIREALIAKKSITDIITGDNLRKMLRGSK